MATKPKVKTEKDPRYPRAYQLLDNLVRAAESGDTQAIEQTAGAGREFLDTHSPE